MESPKEGNGFFIAIGNVFRWALELYFIWGLVLSETGPWTCVVLTLITIGIESNTYLFKTIREALMHLADEMMDLYKK